MHAAGVLNDATLPQQTVNSLRAVFAPKVAGAQRLLQRMGPQPSSRQVLLHLMLIHAVWEIEPYLSCMQ